MWCLYSQPIGSAYVLPDVQVPAVVPLKIYKILHILYLIAAEQVGQVVQVGHG
jgi:hypothetical protein